MIEFFEILFKSILEFGLVLGTVTSIHIYLFGLLIIVIVADKSEVKEHKTPQQILYEMELEENSDLKETEIENEEKKYRNTINKLFDFLFSYKFVFIYLTLTTALFLKSMDKHPNAMKVCLGISIICVIALIIEYALRKIKKNINKN